MALGWQALEAQKASKPLEQGGALEQVGARMKRVMGLTLELTGDRRRGPERSEGPPLGVRVERPVRPQPRVGLHRTTRKLGRVPMVRPAVQGLL